MADAATSVKIQAIVSGVENVEALKNTIRRLQQSVQPAAQDLNALRSAASQLGQASIQTERSLQTQIAVLRDVRSNVALASKEYKELTLEINQAERALSKASATGGGMKRFGQTAGAIAAAGVFGGPEGLIGAGIGGVLGGPGGALAGGAIGAQAGMIRQQIGDMAEYAASIGRLQIALRGVTASSIEYARAQAAITRVSNELNVPVFEATQGFTRLTAAVRGAGGNVTDAEIVFRGISQAIKATGGSAEDVQAALLAMSQVFSKGKVSAEELQGQLGERLPGAVTLFAQATGRTLPQLSKDLQDGVVGLNDLMKFTEKLSEKYADSAEKMAKSTEDAGARMNVALKNLTKSFGDFFQPIGAGIQDLITKFANLVAAAFQANVATREFNIARGKALAEANQKFNATGNILDVWMKPGYKEFVEQRTQQLLESARNKATGPAPGTQTDFNKVVGSATGGKTDAAATLERQRESLRLAGEAINLQFDNLTVQKQIDALDVKIYGQRKLGLDLDALASEKQRLQLQAKLDIKEINDKLALQNAAAAREKDAEAKAQIIANNNNEAQLAIKKRQLRLTQDIKQNEIDTADAIKRQSKEQRDALRAIADRYRYKIIGDLQGGEAADRQQTIDDLKRRIEDAKGRGDTGEAKRLQEQLDAIISQFKQLDELANNAGYGVAKGLRGYLEGIGTLADSVANVTRGVIQSLEDRLMEFFSTGKFNFLDFANYAIQQLQRIVLQQLIMKPLINAISGGIGNLFGGIFGGGGSMFTPNFSALNFAANGMVAANGIRPFAMGGIIDQPTLFRFANGGTGNLGLMGEAGPEAIMPLKRGPDGKLGVAGGGSTSVTVNVDASGTKASGDSGKGDQLGRVVAQAVQAELVKQKRPGGILA